MNFFPWNSRHMLLVFLVPWWIPQKEMLLGWLRSHEIHIVRCDWFSDVFWFRISDMTFRFHFCRSEFWLARLYPISSPLVPIGYRSASVTEPEAILTTREAARPPDVWIRLAEMGGLKNGFHVRKTWRDSGFSREHSVYHGLLTLLWSYENTRFMNVYDNLNFGVINFLTISQMDGYQDFGCEVYGWVLWLLRTGGCNHGVILWLLWYWTQVFGCRVVRFDAKHFLNFSANRGWRYINFYHMVIVPLNSIC